VLFFPTNRAVEGVERALPTAKLGGVHAAIARDGGGHHVVQHFVEEHELDEVLGYPGAIERRVDADQPLGGRVAAELDALATLDRLLDRATASPGDEGVVGAVEVPVVHFAEERKEIVHLALGAERLAGRARGADAVVVLGDELPDGARGVAIAAEHVADERDLHGGRRVEEHVVHAGTELLAPSRDAHHARHVVADVEHHGPGVGVLEPPLEGLAGSFVDEDLRGRRSEPQRREQVLRVRDAQRGRRGARSLALVTLPPEHRSARRAEGRKRERGGHGDSLGGTNLGPPCQGAGSDWWWPSMIPSTYDQPPTDRGWIGVPPRDTLPIQSKVRSMWVRRAAIAPVPVWARVPAAILDRVVDEVSGGEDESETRLRAALARFEATQPVLANELDTVLHERLDETARSLGFFLSVCVWMSFEASFGDRLSTVSEEDAAAVKSILELDEELRKDEPDEPVDTDDVLAMEQPDLLEFVRDHVEVALETAEGEEPVEIDVDAVDKVYRMVLAIVLSLSRAVTPPAYFPTAKAEWTA
jgi:hypothetical protein